MIGFHIDMNTAHFTRFYIEKWLHQLVNCGYDTILWEPEAAVKWDTCPECSSPEAFSKEEFKSLLELSANLGFENIPLLQTLSHCEYVLKIEKYNKFSETDGGVDQYCPRNSEAADFLKEWINEYLDLFGDIKYFHLGGDEALSLGVCDECKSFINQKSVSDLYADHINIFLDALIKKKIKPAVWGDMILSNPGTIEKLPKKLIVFDWMYDSNRSDEVWVWGQGFLDRKMLTEETRKEFESFIFSHSDEPEQIAKPFYTSDYLASRGLEVVKCPAASSFGDSIFAPRHYHHLVNAYGWFNKKVSDQANNYMLTSWTVHMFLYELQLASIDLPSFLAASPSASIDQYCDYFAQKHFGLDDSRLLMKSFDLLAKHCAFSSVSKIGHDKHNDPVDKEFISDQVANFQNENKLEELIEENKTLLKEYQQSLILLETLSAKISKGHDYLDYWLLAARNLIHRAEVSVWLFERALDGNSENNISQKEILLRQLNTLKEETSQAYRKIIKPLKLKSYIHWMYDSLEYALIC